MRSSFQQNQKRLFLVRERLKRFLCLRRCLSDDMGTGRLTYNKYVHKATVHTGQWDFPTYIQFFGHHTKFLVFWWLRFVQHSRAIQCKPQYNDVNERKKNNSGKWHGIFLYSSVPCTDGDCPVLGFCTGRTYCTSFNVRVKKYSRVPKRNGCPGSIYFYYCTIQRHTETTQ